MNAPLPLFRPEALAAKSHQGTGVVILARPVAVRLAVSIALAWLAVLALFLTCGEYTRKVRVQGQIVPSTGSIKVVASQFGRITQRYAKPGASVAVGQPLFEITAARASSNLDELTEHAKALAVRQRSLETEVNTRQQTVVLQDSQIDTARAKLKRHTKLANQGFLSQANLAEVASEVTAQLARRKSLESDVLAIKRDLSQVQAELKAISRKIKLATAPADSLEHEDSNRLQLGAPAAGTVTALVLDTGQTVAAGTTLATIIPADSVLEAHMLVPSRAVGFIAPGQRVLLRISSFPYQKFGQVAGTVERVDQSPISEGQPGAGVESVYRVSVRLGTQSVAADGRKYQFKAGMILEGDILQDRRRLIEWVLNPLIGAAKGRAG